MASTLESHLQRQFEHSQHFFWHRLRWRAVRGSIPKGQRCELVDVGAGAGLLGEYLRRDRPLVEYGFVEPIESLASTLCVRHGAAADRSHATKFDGARFVALLDVLEHQADDNAFMNDLGAKMDAGTVLFITVPASQRLWSRWDVALGHFRRYDKAALTACLEGNGFIVREVAYLFAELYPLAWFRARRGVSQDEPVGSNEAEFPDLPRAVNELAYIGGTASLSLRRWLPFGTSLFAVAVKG